jgi:hypothetical protein
MIQTIQGTSLQRTLNEKYLKKNIILVFGNMHRLDNGR